MERSARVITPGPQMDPEKPGVDHLVDVARPPLPGVTGTAGVDWADPWAHGDPFQGDRLPDPLGVGALWVEGPACGVEVTELVSERRSWNETAFPETWSSRC